MVYKMTEWQGGSGIWHCNDVSDLGHGKGAWYYAAAALNISPVDFVKLVIEKFNADKIYWNEETGFFSYGWTKQANMRKFKNWFNAESRKCNIQL